MNNLARSTVSAAKLVAMWNERFPVGTPVTYWPGRREGHGQLTTTSSEAQLLGGHTPVVWLYDVSGCVALSHVEPLPPAPLRSVPHD
jgi:hypothetical protein